MPRKKKPRCIRFTPGVYYYKPAGVPLRDLEEVELELDEVEALKLHDVDGYDHTTSSEKMKISQPTFGRILDSAYRKVANALISGKAVRIKKR